MKCLLHVVSMLEAHGHADHGFKLLGVEFRIRAIFFSKCPNLIFLHFHPKRKAGLKEFRNLQKAIATGIIRLEGDSYPFRELATREAAEVAL